MAKRTLFEEHIPSAIKEPKYYVVRRPGAAAQKRASRAARVKRLIEKQESERRGDQ